MKKHFVISAMIASALVFEHSAAHATSIEEKVKLYAICSGYMEYGKTFAQNHGKSENAELFEKVEVYSLRYANELANGNYSLQSLARKTKKNANIEAALSTLTRDGAKQFTSVTKFCSSNDFYYPLLVRYEGAQLKQQ